MPEGLTLAHIGSQVRSSRRRFTADCHWSTPRREVAADRPTLHCRCSNCCLQRSAMVQCSLMLVPLPRPTTCPLMLSMTTPRRQPLYRHRPLVLTTALPGPQARSGYRRRSRRPRPPCALRPLRVLHLPWRQLRCLQQSRCTRQLLAATSTAYAHSWLPLAMTQPRDSSGAWTVPPRCTSLRQAVTQP
jgi:hypothetical protein